MQKLLCTGLLYVAVPGLVVASDAATRCDDLYLLTDGDHTVAPGILIESSGDTPAHCQVNGVIDGTIRFQVSMPVEGWSGRFLYHAPGGLAGEIRDTTSMIDDGFAMATTDAGHDRGNFDSSFYKDDERKLNFAFRANHMTTALAKRVIATFYGREIEYSYLWGCSNGGRAALMEALRYPEDFDGIIAGDPAIDYGYGLLPWTLEASRQQARHPLTADSVALLDANSKKTCGGLDGLEDGLIGDPRKCTLDVLDLEALECKDGPAADCLTQGQIETARFFYTGVTDEDGNVVVPGIYPGAETGGDFELWVTGNPAFMEGSANELTATVLETVMHREPGFTLEGFETVRDQDDVRRVMAAVDVPKPDFREFHANGGKLIIYSGWHDHPCRAKVLEDFHVETQQLNGDDVTEEFLRTFLVPGMVHCIGGPGAWAADYIQAIIEWVEEDQAPDRLIAEHVGELTFVEAQVIIAGQTVSWNEAARNAHAAREGVKRFSRPLCPYPKWAKYNGKGDPNDAANFDCVDE